MVSKLLGWIGIGFLLAVGEMRSLFLLGFFGRFKDEQLLCVVFPVGEERLLFCHLLSEGDTVFPLHVWVVEGQKTPKNTCFLKNFFGCVLSLFVCFEILGTPTNKLTFGRHSGCSASSSTRRQPERQTLCAFFCFLVKHKTKTSTAWDEAGLPFPSAPHKEKKELRVSDTADFLAAEWQDEGRLQVGKAKLLPLEGWFSVWVETSPVSSPSIPLLARVQTDDWSVKVATERLKSSPPEVSRTSDPQQRSVWGYHLGFMENDSTSNPNKCFLEASYLYWQTTRNQLNPYPYSVSQQSHESQVLSNSKIRHAKTTSNRKNVQHIPTNLNVSLPAVTEHSGGFFRSYKVFKIIHL